MLIAVFGFSLDPLIVALADGGRSPFIYSFIYRSSTAIGLLLYLAISFRSFFATKSARSLIWQQLRRRDGLLAILSRFDFALFAWSTQFLDTAVAAILFESWLILFIFLRHFHDSRQNNVPRYSRVRGQDYLLLLTALTGLGLVILSQAIGTADSRTPHLYLALGVVLVLIGAAFSGGTAYVFRCGDILYSSTRQQGIAQSRSSNKDELACQLIIFGLTGLLAGVASGAIGVFDQLLWGTHINVFSIQQISTIVLMSVPALIAVACFRIANLRTTNLGINAMIYFAPVLAVVWLAVFTSIKVTRVDLLIIGAAAVISVNVLINFRIEDRLGFKWLVLALWSSGLVIYLRDGWLETQLGSDWLIDGAEYYSLLTLSSTVFILILSFRTSRLVNRTIQEKNRAILLFRRLELHVLTNTICPKSLEKLRDIDQAQRASHLRGAYEFIRGQIGAAKGPPGSSHISAEEASTLQHELDMLVHSKQQGRNLSELVVLSIFAIIMLIISLSTRPNLVSWSGFLVDLFAMLFAAATVFLTVNIFDRRRDRSHPTFDEKRYSIRFREGTGADREKASLEHGFSIGIGFAIVVIYIVLFLDKWSIY